MTTFFIDHQCPQCGAPAELAETDRLLRCGFCRVSSYLSMPDHFRYVLPHRAPAGKALFYFPYWRFKGLHVACLSSRVESRVVDVSQQALPSLHFPISVGFRSQTQKLRFAAAETGARFLRVKTRLADFLALLNQRLTEELNQPIVHQVQIGETVSLLYAPFYLNPQVHDALLNRALPDAGADAVAPLLADTEQPAWPIHFMAALCPHCGHDLAGERDACVLTCSNCRRAWRAEQDRLAEVECGYMPIRETSSAWLPFWRMQAAVSPIALSSYADLIKTANLPKVAPPGAERRSVFFYAPAFKLRPQALLTAATIVTLNQPEREITPGAPAGRLQSANLPLQEAAEMIKPVIAGIMRPRERMVEILPAIRTRIQAATLVYLPFTETGHELVHPDLQLAVNKKMLAHSKTL